VTTTPIAAVLGANCRRIRTAADVTQDELARAARQLGLKWTASKVRDFEAGRTAPTFATVLALTAALDSVANGEPVRLADVVNLDGGVTITEDFCPSGNRLANYCSGGSWEHGLALDPDTVLDWPGLTEERIAAGLGISTGQLCDVSLKLWKTSFSAHRDHIAGPDANPQRKGQVSRQLRAELAKAITDGND
jgi:transcriptional regulator with XRE-family HTH domain